MIYDVYKTVLTIANKENYGEITPERFGYLAINAQNKLFGDILSEYKRAKGKDYNSLRTKMLKNVLDIFYVTDEPIKKKDNNQYYLISDIGNVVYIDKIWYMSSTEVLMPDKGISGIIKRNKYLKATKDYPYAEISSGRIYVYPLTIGAKIGTIYPDDVTVNYYRNPSNPNLGVISVGGKLTPSESSNSTIDFELPQTYFNKLVIYILEQIGVTLREQEIEAYTGKESQSTTQTDNL